MTSASSQPDSTPMYKLWTFPDVPSWNTMFMLEAMTFKIALVVEKSVNPSTDLLVEAWTNIYHKDNPEGEWHGIPLELISSNDKTDSDMEATFGNGVILTSDGRYSFTFRFRHKKHNDWLWAGGFGENGNIDVRPPSGDNWTKGPNFDHILGPVHLGNFIAASVADQLQFDAVLNLADTLDLVTSKFSRPVDYKKIPMRDGAMNPIPQEQVAEAVGWLQDRSRRHSKILVNCRAGIGRAGSVVVAFVFAQNVSMSYSQAYHYVFSRRFVYPHRGLKDTLYTLFPRQPADSP